MDRDLRSLQEARDLVAKADSASTILKKLPQAVINSLVKSMSDAAYANRELLAKMAVEETGFGIVSDKIIKNTIASHNVYEFIKDMKTVGIIDHGESDKVMKVAAPVGIVTGLVPSTNPTSTVIYKALISVKAGNPIIFSPHPAAVKCIAKTVEILAEALKKEGAPDSIISCMLTPTLEGTAELMTHPRVAYILATGGPQMVKEAYSSGRPALGVGPGNVPAFIERSADIKMAVKRIMVSKTFDNGTICASEQSIVTEAVIKSEVIKELEYQGCYFLDKEETARVEKVLQLPNGGLNARVVGRSANEIARMAGVSIPSEKTVLVSEQSGVGSGFPFSREKLCPTLAFYTVENWEKACERCLELLAYGGMGHSLAIHSNNEDVIRQFALSKPVSRILVNTPSTHGAIGVTTNLPPSLTLGCGSPGRNATSDNITPLHLIDIRSVAYGVRDAEPGESEASSVSPNFSESYDQYISEITRMVLEKLNNK